MVELFRRPLRATNHGLCSLRVICVTARNGPKPLWTHHITGPIERSRLAMTTNKKFPMCGYMRGSLPATLGGICRSGCWSRGVYFSLRFELPQKSQNRTGKYLFVTFWVFKILIHQRAASIEDIKLHIDNFCIVWYISIFLLTVAVYYAYMAGLEVWDLRNFSWFGGLIYFHSWM